MIPQNIFQNERLTYRLNLIAQGAISANDQLFLDKTGYRIREHRVLRLIDDQPGITFAKISKITGFEKSLSSRIIQLLLSKGLIERKNSEEDARVFMLYTTAEGKALRLRGRELSNRLEVILTDPLSTQELRFLNEILERLGSWVTSRDYQLELESQREKEID